MKKRKDSSPEDVILDSAFVDKVVNTITDELEIEKLGFEEKDTLERIVILSIGLYMMELRESVNKTSRLTQ